MMLKKYFLILIISLIVHVVSAQVTVDQTYTIEQYVNDILLGSGVQATNITFTGDMVQIGYLENAEETIFPMASGLVLSSDNAGNLSPGFMGDFFTGVSGDADLMTIANSVPPLIGQNFTVNSINDLCILEFDFIAAGDSVKFNYSFGSDEYLEWVNSTYNDIFAFFLSGPGITGPYNSPAGFPGGAINIAGVPDADPPLPITISSVNDQINSEFYIDNFANTDVAIDGFSTLLEASHQVECGGTYHIKLAIADGSDTALESVVVLEAGSFSSNSVVQVDLSIDVGGGVGAENNTLYEDCGSATITFTRPIETVLEIQEMVFIEYTGVAIEGVDYNFLPDTIIFEPFVQSVSFEIDAFEDGIIEGLELVQMEILNLAACNGGGLTSYFEFFIDDFPEPLVVDDYSIEMCLGDTMEIAPLISGGYGNYGYLWNNGETTESLIVNPTSSTSYNVIVSDTCGMPSDDGNIDITILEFDALSVNISPGDITLDCGGFADLFASASGGDGNYSNWTWTDQNGDMLFGFGSSLFISSWDGLTFLTVTVTDGCGFTASDIIAVSYNVPALVIESEPVLVACNEDVEACVDVSGGMAPYSYFWFMNGVNDFSQFSNCYSESVESNDVLIVVVSDACGQEITLEIEFIFPSTDLEVNTPDEISGNCIEEMEIAAVVTGGTPPYTYQWSNDGFNLGGGTPLNFVPGEEMTVQLSVVDQCGIVITNYIDFILINPPATLVLPEDILVSCIDTTLIIPTLIEGLGDIQYSWIIQGEEEGQEENLMWQTYNVETIELTITDECGSEATDNILLTPNDPPLLISTSPLQTICPGESADIFVNAEGGVSPYTFFWHSFDSDEPVQAVSPITNNSYGVSVTDQCGSSVVGSTTVNLSPIDVEYFSEAIDESVYQFGAVVYPVCDGNCQYSWDFGDGNTSTIENPIHSFNGFEVFEGSLTVVNQIGCIDSVNFTILPPPMIYIPGAFTPNEDGINDVFRVYGTSITEYEISVYNRWGILVYYSTDINEVWVGELSDRNYYLQNEIYHYTMTIKGLETDRVTKNGYITVLR